MDVRLKELIETIKADGLKQADEAAARVIAEAERKAAEIVAAAKNEASEILSRAHHETDRRVMSGDEALRQSGRDLILNVSKQLERIFSAVTRREVKDALTSAVLEEAIVTVVKNWKRDSRDPVTVTVPKADLEKIEAHLRAKLAGEFASGVEIVPTEGLKSGFRIAEKGGSAYYDFSSESIAEALSAYLNPRLAALLREAAGKE